MYWLVLNGTPTPTPVGAVNATDFLVRYLTEVFVPVMFMVLIVAVALSRIQT